MKLICYLSALFVLLLTAKPCCADTDCGNKVSVAKNTQVPSSPKEKDCQGCSPFFACGSCTGFTVSKAISYTSVLLPEKKIEHIVAYQQPYIEAVTLSIWQPPQIS